MLELRLDELEKRGINRYKAVLMAAQEARFINDQTRLGIIKQGQKPTTAALQVDFFRRTFRHKRIPLNSAGFHHLLFFAQVSLAALR
jgi:DNA-directed RNA polymerase subunit K/omega